MASETLDPVLNAPGHMTMSKLVMKEVIEMGEVEKRKEQRL